jgi:hypothetical protein
MLETRTWLNMGKFVVQGFQRIIELEGELLLPKKNVFQISCLENPKTKGGALVHQGDNVKER